MVGHLAKMPNFKFIREHQYNKQIEKYDSKNNHRIFSESKNEIHE